MVGLNAFDRATQARRATLVGIAGNTLLFAVKGTVGVISGSIALVSDALNSLVDVVASIGISYSVAVAHRAPDEDHPFGHHRAEPLAALGVAIFTAILGFSVGRAAIERLLEGSRPIRTPVWALGALLLSMAGNLLLARYLRRKGEALKSPAILANAVESENDIWASLAAFVGVGGAALGWTVVDPVAGLLVGAWIIYGGFRFGRRNIDYLMGKSPRPELLDRIRRNALEVQGVRGLHDVRGHYVGHRIHVEVHIEVDQELRTRQSHDVAGAVRHAIEQLPEIERAFVHVDPVLDSTYVIETLTEIQRAASVLYAAFAGHHADRPALVALWEALATAAQARAERLTVVRRFRAAGWYFADSELSTESVRSRRERMQVLGARVRRGAVTPEEALAIAIEIEGEEPRLEVRQAVTPRDSTLAASLAAGAPPPPSTGLLRKRLEGARASLPDGVARERLDTLRRALEEESPGSSAQVGRPSERP